MNPLRNIWFLLFSASVISCSPKIHPTLKRKEIIAIKIEPIINQPIALTNTFQIGLLVKLNNGKTKRKFFDKQDSYLAVNRNLEYNNEYQDAESSDYWKNFSVKTYNCYFQEGVIYFDRSLGKTPKFVAIKIISNNELASDSIFIKIPKLTQVKIEYENNSTLSPNFEVPLSLKAYYDNGENYIIQNKNRFETYSGNYIVKIQGQVINYPYLYRIPNILNFKKSFLVSFKHTSDSQFQDSMLVPIKYDGHYKFLFHAEKGQNGENGNDGLVKLRSRNGEDGSCGKNGQQGSKGRTVNVLLKSTIIDSTIFIKSIAYSNGNVQACLFDPKLGKLTITNMGGDGGNGGNGGCGENGENQTENNLAGFGGKGGRGGDGADGGKGGNFIIYADSLAGTFFNSLILLNPGGNGGRGGRGGKNGLNGNEKKTSFAATMLLFPIQYITSGRGDDGIKGLDGQKGDEPIFEIISMEKMEELEQRLKEKSSE